MIVILKVVQEQFSGNTHYNAVQTMIERHFMGLSWFYNEIPHIHFPELGIMSLSFIVDPICSVQLQFTIYNYLKVVFTIYNLPIV